MTTILTPYLHESFEEEYHNGTLTLFFKKIFIFKYESINDTQFNAIKIISINKENHFINNLIKTYSTKINSTLLLSEDNFRNIINFIPIATQEEGINKFLFKKLIINNYKKFTSLELDFDNSTSRKVVAFIGENASGKTSIIDALATAIGGFYQAIPGKIKNEDYHSITKDDIHFEFSMDGATRVNHIFNDSYINIYTSINNIDISWKRTLKNEKSKISMPKKENKEIFLLNEIFTAATDNNFTPTLPVFSYHGTGRVWEQSIFGKKKKIWTTTSKERFSAYKDSLKAASNYQQFNKWFKELYLVARDMDIIDPKVEIFKTVIVEIFNKLNENDEILNVLVAYGEIEILFKNKKSYPIKHLSDGYKNIIGIVTDILYRIILLNPHLKTKNSILNVPGIVLIDEIDLHLHPKWQRKIVSLLCELFPNIQFFITTHSPFIIQSLNQNELISLEPISSNEVALISDDINKKSVEDIAEQYMNIITPQQSEKVKRMYILAEKYYNLLNLYDSDKISSEEIKKIKEELDDISMIFSEEIAYHAFLKNQRLLSELKRMTIDHETNK